MDDIRLLTWFSDKFFKNQKGIKAISGKSSSDDETWGNYAVVMSDGGNSEMVLRVYEGTLKAVEDRAKAVAYEYPKHAPIKLYKLDYVKEFNIQIV